MAYKLILALVRESPSEWLEPFVGKDLTLVRDYSTDDVKARSVTVQNLALDLVRESPSKWLEPFVGKDLNPVRNYIKLGGISTILPIPRLESLG